MKPTDTYTNIFDNKILDDQRVPTSSDTQSQALVREVQGEPDLLGPFYVEIGKCEDLEIIRFPSYRMRQSYTPYL